MHIEIHRCKDRQQEEQMQRKWLKMNNCTGSCECDILVPHSLAVLGRASVHIQVLLLDLLDSQIVPGVLLPCGDPLVSLHQAPVFTPINLWSWLALYLTYQLSHVPSQSMDDHLGHGDMGRVVHHHLHHLLRRPARVVHGCAEISPTMVSCDRLYY